MISKLLHNLHEIAWRYNADDYGLPLADEAIVEVMRKSVADAFATQHAAIVLHLGKMIGLARALAYSADEELNESKHPEIAAALAVYTQAKGG